MNYNPETKRRAENSKARWIVFVDNGARKTGVRNWRMYAKDRDGCRRILEEARFVIGLRCHR
jgi:hypothetical protein